MTPTLAANLLSSSIDRAPLDPEVEDSLWQMCDYSSLTNSARTSATKDDVQQRLMSSTPRDHVEVRTVGQTPDFEALYQGALSLDYSLLEDGTDHVYTSNIDFR